MTAPPDLGLPRLASPDLLRSVFRRHAAGVAVITASGGTGPVGFTATSLSSVSAEPPMLSFGIGTGASSWPAVSGAEYVGPLSALPRPPAPRRGRRGPAGARGPGPRPAPAA
ncbi:flavin reductase family protein, partial [Streptomyces hayashii]|uniref:flavin reductase family protein n=1 Tax=Streptomyces hayashii TaxID=2839966 RepID=UPI00403C431F